MKSTYNRRHFITTMGAGLAATQVMPLRAYSTGVSRAAYTENLHEYWIDTRFTTFKTPWRKVHLDFHNSEHVAKIGDKFNAREWGDRVVEGNLDSIVIFAKDMHGYFYYPSEYGPVHPGLSFDLMGEQVKACKERGVAVYAYYCTAWDHYRGDAHPEWNMVKKDGSDYRPAKGQTPGWTALCLGNKEFVDHIARDITELVSNYELDGAWFDMAEPIVPECYCKECIRQIKAEGKDPYNKDVQREHQNKNFLDFHRRMKDLVHSIKPGCQADFNDIGIGRLSERAEFLDSTDIEALPTSPGWGYLYAPLQVRYQRNFGIPVYGMTGRFNASWADFGGLKLPQQLDVELASLVANAARCDVGDQMPPGGELDKAVYHVLGKSFGRIKRLEPWLDQAAPVTEAAMLMPDVALELNKTPYLYGIVKLMMEANLQFDVTEDGQEWERYRLIVVPDELMPDKKTVERLKKYVSNGGSLIVCHNGGLMAENKQPWLEQYGFSYQGTSPYKPAYLVADDGLLGDMPGYEYALYDGASQWKVSGSAKTLAILGEPLYQRSAEHYTSHRHWPFDHETDYSALAVSGKVGLIGFPIGESYYNKGYWVYREAFKKVLDKVYPQRMVETDAPFNTELTVTYQPEDKELNRPERYIVHLVNWSPSRKSPVHPEVHEAPVALTGVRVKLNIPPQNINVQAVTSGQKLAVNPSDNGLEVTIPKILTHEIICFENN
ncbi:MAG: alpha-amylase family protein [Bacteroidota bacterium]